MKRIDEILSVFDDKDKPLARPLITEMVFLEERLDYLRSLPFIRVHPEKPEIQKSTPAAKMYKELLQQYTNVYKITIRASGEDESKEDSPLRKWVKSRNIEIG